MKLERKDGVEWTFGELACVLAIVVILGLVAAYAWAAMP